MNLVLMTGRLTKAPELRYTPDNTPVATFTVATNEGKSKSGADLTQFIHCEAWESDAENISRFFSQGSPIIITGRNMSESWEKNGERRYRQYVRVNRWEFPQGAPKEKDSQPDTPAGFADVDGVDLDGELPF